MPLQRRAAGTLAEWLISGHNARIKRALFVLPQGHSAMRRIRIHGRFCAEAILPSTSLTVMGLRVRIQFPSSRQVDLGHRTTTVLFDAALRVLLKFSFETTKIEVANNVVLI